MAAAAAASLTSPGAATAERARKEADALVSASAGLEKFLNQLRISTTRTGAVPTLGEVLGAWDALAVRLAQELDGGSPETLARLRSSLVPVKAHATAAETLAFARGERLSKAATRRELYEALDPDTGTWERTTDGLTLRGANWRAALAALVRTEATAAVGRQSLADLAEAQFPSKMWVARIDSHTRHTHMEANGTVVPLGQDFIVGGFSMAYPGDPKGPAEQTYNCRCVLVGHGTTTQEQAQLSGAESFAAFPRGEDYAVSLMQSLPTYSPEQRAAMDTYIGGSRAVTAEKMNFALRQGTMPKGKAGATIASLDQMFAATPGTSEPGVLYLGMSGAHKFPQTEPGTELKDLGFVSTTLAAHQAEKFADRYSGTGGEPLIFEIKAPAGTRMVSANLASIGHVDAPRGLVDYEGEMLLNRGSSFTVVSDAVEDWGTLKNVRVIRMELS